MQYTADGRDGRASVRPHFPEVASTAMGALATQTLALFSAERSQSPQYRIANFSARDPGQPAGTLPQCAGARSQAAAIGGLRFHARHGGGFSVNASVCIAGDDRAGLERLLRYCARPPFAMERLHRKGQDHLLYHCPKPQSDGAAIRGKQGDLILTPLEFIAKIAALVPPPRTRQHRYFGVLPPNSPSRAAVTAMAPMPVMPPVAPPIEADQEAQANTKRSPARYLWASTFYVKTSVIITSHY